MKGVSSWVWWLLVLAVGAFVIIGISENKKTAKNASVSKEKNPLNVINYNEFTSLIVEPGKTYKIVFNEPGKSGLVNLRYVGHFRIESDSGHYSWYSGMKEAIYEPPRHEREEERATNLNLDRENARFFIESRTKSNEVTIKTWKNTFN